MTTRLYYLTRAVDWRMYQHIDLKHSLQNSIAQSPTCRNESLKPRSHGYHILIKVFVAVKRARVGEDEEPDHINELRKFIFSDKHSLILYLD